MKRERDGVEEDESPKKARTGNDGVNENPGHTENMDEQANYICVSIKCCLSESYPSDLTISSFYRVRCLPCARLS